MKKMNKVFKVCFLGVALSFPLTSVASIQMKVFVNGYETIYKDEDIGGVRYDNITYQLTKLRNNGGYLNKAVVKRDHNNSYTISYKTQNRTKNFENVLMGVMGGDFEEVADLKIESSEELPKEKLLMFFSKNVPLTNYITKCVDGNLISHYFVKDGELDGTVDAGSKIHFDFKIDLNKKKIISNNVVASTCTSTLVKEYGGSLNVGRLSPFVQALSTNKI